MPPFVKDDEASSCPSDISRVLRLKPLSIKLRVPVPGPPVIYFGAWCYKASLGNGRSPAKAGDQDPKNP